MSWYFGCDSGTSSNPCGTQFYLGRMGYGTTVDVYWTMEDNTVPAYPYWNIQGPIDTPYGQTAQEWGANQADAFWNYLWGPEQYPGGYPGNTMFGAVSSSSGGWYSDALTNTAHLAANRDVVSGFLNKLANNNNASGYGVTYGLYGSQTSEFHNLLEASDWDAPQPIVVWIADALTSLPDCTEVDANYCPMPSVGGYFPMIWQYYQGSTGEELDYDVTPYAGGVDIPENGSPQWHPTTPPGIC